jgi:hypothetical protein
MPSGCIRSGSPAHRDTVLALGVWPPLLALISCLCSISPFVMAIGVALTLGDCAVSRRQTARGSNDHVAAEKQA